jgi:hypothetical protein
MIVLGSKAMLTLTGETHSRRFLDRDIDVVMSTGDLQAFFERNRSFITHLVPKTPYKYGATLVLDGQRYTYEIETEVQPSSAWLLAEIRNFQVDHYVDPFGNTFAVPCREALFLTKKSHINMNVHFDKNMADFHALNQGLDPVKLECLNPYFRLRHHEAKERYQYRHPKLNVTNDAFFDRSKNVVGYVFVHDDIHEAIKHFERPVYEMMKKDMGQAWCEKDMFFELPLDTRIKCVQEEAYVIAIERFIALQKGSYQDHFLAYKDALRRICTTLCSGFFRDFAVDHYFEVLQAYDATFFERFQSALKDQAVQRIDSCPEERFNATVDRLLAL